MRVAIIVLPESISAQVVGTSDMLREAFAAHNQMFGLPMLELVFVGPKREVTLSSGIGVHCQHTLEEDYQPDVVFIPSLDWGDLPVTLARHQSTVDWLRTKAEAGAELASMCGGAFLLASTGLLDGQRATVHWAYEQPFRAMFPKVNLTIEELVVDNGKYYCGGGATSYLNLLLYFIDRKLGRPTMLWAAKFFLVDPDKQLQSYFSIFQAHKQHGDKLILQAQETMEVDYAKELVIDKLADQSAMSTRHFIRRFKDATGHTPLAYLQKLRVEVARQALEQPHRRVNEVVFEVGYQDEKSFREVFKRHTGLSPQEYKRKYCNTPNARMVA